MSNGVFQCIVCGAAGGHPGLACTGQPARLYTRSECDALIASERERVLAAVEAVCERRLFGGSWYLDADAFRLAQVVDEWRGKP